MRCGYGANGHMSADKSSNKPDKKPAQQDSRNTASAARYFRFKAAFYRGFSGAIPGPKRYLAASFSAFSTPTSRLRTALILLLNAPSGP